eukprot:TRINITY_DN833_c0_g1_i1.p1 TRINITY_DN833_c0_g1~~TRINITY_DN833_c0_g1_i1.p1  ORF type:complete len:220 (+),score=49.63 TRINITY_DN833_c0_g1_i1:38-661(+)
MKTLVIVLALLFLSTVYCFSTGQIQCLNIDAEVASGKICDDMCSNAKTDGDGGFSFGTTEYTPGQAVSISLTTTTPFIGIFCYVQDQQDSSSAVTRVGTWTVEAGGLFGNQACTQQNINHLSSVPKNGQTFTWNAPGDASGDKYLNCFFMVDRPSISGCQYFQVKKTLSQATSTPTDSPPPSSSVKIAVEVIISLFCALLLAASWSI